MSKPNDDRPIDTDLFLLKAHEVIDDHFDLRHAIKNWLEGAWDEAIQCVEDYDPNAFNLYRFQAGPEPVDPWHRVSDPNAPRPPENGDVIFIWHEQGVRDHSSYIANIRKARYIKELEEWQVESYGGNIKPTFEFWTEMLPTPNFQAGEE